MPRTAWPFLRSNMHARESTCDWNSTESCEGKPKQSVGSNHNPTIWQSQPGNMDTVQRGNPSCPW